MKKILLLVLFIATFQLQAQEPNFVSNEILVRLHDDVAVSTFIQEVPELEIFETKLISKTLNIWQIRYNAPTISEDEAITLAYQNQRVFIAQKNHIVTNRATTPDDPLFDNQWQYFQENDRDIDADEAWDVTTGGTTLNGDVIVTGVVDDGFNINHPDLANSLWINEEEIPDNNIDDDANGYIDDVNGWNAFNSNGDLLVLGHGTAVFGIIGAEGNNGTGVTGVNWDAKVMPVSGSSGNEATVLEAYSYILEARMLYNETNGAEGAFVVATNASFGVDFGNPDNFPLWCGMYDTLGENGILNCGATINGNQNVDVIGDVPTACPSEFLISVTNTNINDQKVTSAGFGAETIDLGAPGAGAFTTSLNGYGGFGGTSGATPHVTGTISLLYSAPCQNFADLALSDPAQAARIIRDLILENVDPNPTLEGITTTGGRLNVNNAMQALMNECAALSIDEASIEEIEIFPNPASTSITISTANKRVDQIAIYNLQGALIKKIDTFSNNNIDISDLSKGMYIVRISLEGDQFIVNRSLLKE